MNIIETNNLTKYYGKAKGIEGINLKVEEGDVFGFIGPNGAGKSTTIRTLLGLITPTSGSAKIFGKECSRGNKDILNDIGYMPSEVWFYQNMRVGELIKLSAKLQKKDCSKEAQILCDRLELDVKKKIDKIFAEYDVNDEILALTDVYGGSITSVIAEYIDKRNIHIITGVNLGMFLEACLVIEQMSMDELVPYLLKQGKSAIHDVNEELSSAKGDEI